MLFHRRAFWCARPDTLNDPEEFAWTCDFKPSRDTVRLLTDLLIRQLGRSRDHARHRAVQAVSTGRLKILAEPIVTAMIQQCRDEIGLGCFGRSPDNKTLWDRYAASGAGVCVEVDVPDDILGKQLFNVEYWDEKRIHIDQLLRARLEPNHVAEVYILSLLSKPSFWAPEAEIRFVSKRQNINVVINGSEVTRVILGESLSPAVKDEIVRTAGALPTVPRGSAIA